MQNRFFNNHRQDLQFDWNSASSNDWRMIKRNFVAAYLSSYKDQPIDTLNVSNLEKARQKWVQTYELGLEGIKKDIILPLSFYFSNEKIPFTQELATLTDHFNGLCDDISQLSEYFIKLLNLKFYFEKEFEEEFEKIDERIKNINYLVVRFHERPIAFFSTELNFKSARIYLRWVTMEPAFHRMGLGHIALDEIRKYYPESIGMELFTRKANKSAQAFYNRYGLQPTNNFDFVEHGLFKGDKNKLHLPIDDAVKSNDAFVAFVMPFKA